MQLRLKFLLVFFLPACSMAQGTDWWAATVNWDGITHWSRYMITQPGFQGPNSLPVPRIGNGSLDSSLSLAATGNLHFTKGDHTQNLSLHFNYCILKDRISIDASWVPYERYDMTKTMKEKRHVFSQFYYDHEATGEVYLNTNFQLLSRWRKYIHLVLRVGYRFPNGSGYGAARYTDGPGYHFDVSFGKPFNGTSLKWVGMLGFYAWQIVSDKHRQNDAFLFGTGLEWNKNSWRLQTNVAGYLGYMEDTRDKPIVLRASAEKRWQRNGLILGFQYGLHHFDYTSVEMGMRRYF